MQTKRSRRNIWKLIDSIMLLLPLIFLLIVFICYCFQYNGFAIPTDEMFSLGGMFDEVLSIFDRFYELMPWFNFGDNDYHFANDFYEFIISIFGFFDLDYQSGIWDFIVRYLTYAFIYEFLSLFVNIIMWLPRWARNKFNESGD